MRGAWLAAALAAVAMAVAALLWAGAREERTPLPVGGESRPVGADGWRRDGDVVPATQPGQSAEGVASRTVAGTGGDLRSMTIRGRAVDDGGRPLPGVAVAVTGQPKYRDFDEFVIAHGPVSFAEPAPRTTGADGRFAVTFATLPPFRVTLALRAAARVPVEIAWPALAAGAVADVGDVVLVAGCRVSGRVVDGDGRARGGARFVVHESRSATAKLPEGAAGGDVVASGQGAFTAGEGGAFVLERRVGVGALTFVPEDGTTVTPTTVAVVAGVPEQHVVLTVVDVPDARCIRGRVVDESGIGIADAVVRALRQGAVARTGTDGRYTLVRDEAQNGEPTIVTATKEGYDAAAVAEPVAFGSRDVVVVLRAGVPCRIVVRDGVSGRPVERFGVRIRPVASDGFEGSAVLLRHAGDHPGGRLDLAGLRRGAHELTVEADPARFPPSPLQRFDVVDGMGPVVVALFPLVDFEVFVRDDGGAPVVGSSAELLEVPARVGAAAARPLEDRMAIPRGDLGRTYGDLVYSVAQASSGADGVARMRTPRGAAFALRVSGAHTMVVLRDVDTATGRIEVRVPRGASIAGRVVPAGVLQSRLAGDGCGLLRTLQIRSVDGTRRFPLSGMAEVDAKEGFRIEGVPGGDWVLEVTCVSAWPGAMRSAMLPIATVDGLMGGETREIVVNVAKWRPATLRARVDWNGRPAVGRIVKASVGIPSVRGGTVTVFGGGARVGDDGVAVLGLVPGQVTMALSMEDGGDLGVGRDLRCAETCELVGGDVLERTFSVRSARLRVRVVGGAGEGVPGVRVVVSAGAEVVVSGATDAGGRVEIGELVLRDYAMGVLPRAVADQFARGEVVDHRGVEDVRVGTVVVVDALEEVLVRMPQGAGY